MMVEIQVLIMFTLQFSTSQLQLILYLGMFVNTYNVRADHLSYPDGILINSQNASKIKPLSDLYLFRENTSVTFHPYPVPPDCSNILNVEEEQYPATVTLWSLDLKSSSEWGLLVWKEKIETFCTWEFWGTYKGSEGKRSTVELNPSPKLESLTDYWGLQENQVVEYDHVDYSSRYSCYWCRNEHRGEYEMVYVKKVRLLRYPDGGLRNPPGEWIALTSSLLKDSNRILHTQTIGRKDNCPFKIYGVKAAVLSHATSGNVILSVPISNLQFSLNPKSDGLMCSYEGAVYEIVQSLGGYLLSVDTGASNWKGPWRERTSIRERRQVTPHYPDDTTKRFHEFVTEGQKDTRRKKRNANMWEFSRGLKTSLDYAQLRYEQNYVIQQINRNFGLLQKSICENQYRQWLNIYPPQLPTKIAHYITGHIYSTGDVHFGGYSVYHTEKSMSRIDLVDPLHVIHGMFKAIRFENNEVVWIEPVTGILYHHPAITHFSQSANWLPGLNGTAIIPSTGRIMIPEITIDHLKLVEQSEAKNVKALYSDSELYGSSSEFNNYRRSTSIDEPVKDFWTELPPLIIHFGLSLITCLLVAIVAPSIMRLLRKLAKKGEQQLEYGLHLNHRDPKNQNRPIWE